MPQSSRSSKYLRSTAIAILAGLASTVLAGCALSAPQGGGSSEELTAIVEEMPGIRDSTISVVGSYSGLARESSLHLEVSVLDGYVIEDADNVFDWMLGTAWSLNEEEPNRRVLIRVTDASGTPLEWGWREVVEARGWDAETVGKFYLEDGYLGVPVADVEAALGSWPGPIPEAPGELFAVAP